MLRSGLLAIRAKWWCIAWCACLGACGVTRGPLFEARDASEAANADAGVGAIDASISDAGADAAVRQGMRLQYQLVGAHDPAADVDLFVLDLFETSSAQVARLHAGGRSVVAFIAAGSYEPWRDDVDSLPDAVIGEPLAGYPNEAWLDVRAASVRQLMVGRLTQAEEKGFDGVLLVSLDAYLADSGHPLTAATQLEYNRWLAQEATKRRLLPGISSDWAHAAELAEHYAFAVHLGCVEDQRCGELTPYRQRGKPVFDLETSGEVAQVCAEAARLSLSVTLKRSGFDAWFHACP
jgi:hypothetical protein